jgi:hypothetical protein
MNIINIVLFILQVSKFGNAGLKSEIYYLKKKQSKAKSNQKI